MKKVLLILTIVFCLIISANASEKIKLGVYDLEAKNIDPGTAGAISEMLRTELFNTGRFTIVNKENMDKVLKEQAFQKTGCTTTECAVEIGRILNINSMLVGSLSKVGGIYTVTVNLVDVERSETVIAESDQTGISEPYI